MKKYQSAPFFIVLAAILFVIFTSFFGITTQYGDYTTVYIKGAGDIRWGIDIRGGVDVVFSPPEGVVATEYEMASAEAIIKLRLLNQNITDSEVYTDYDRNRIIVRFPWKSDEVDFNPEQAILELGETAQLTFREGLERDGEYKPAGVTAENIILEGRHVVSASAGTNPQTGAYLVILELDEEGKGLFAEATARLLYGTISIWMDDEVISAPTVEAVISDGTATISGNFTAEEAIDLANKISAGALPFKLQTESFSTISPTLGEGAKNAMVLAGAIAFVIIAIIMIVFYRLPGFVAVIALAGQVALTIASITGYFGNFSSFTLTLPGIAGIILGIGFGVDANIITAERIKEELKAGKTLDGAVSSGFKRAFSAILDGNITIIIVAVILMGAFGPPNTLFSTLLSPVFRWFGLSTAGAIYSFGYTLLVSVILVLVMGVLSSRIMLKSLSKMKAFRNPALYGGAK